MKLNLKTALILGVALLLVVGGGVVAARHFLGNDEQSEGEPESERDSFAQEHLYQVEEIVTNLADQHRRALLQAGIELATRDAETLELLLERQVPVRHRIIATIRSWTSEDVAGDEGMLLLGQEIMDAVNGLLGPGSIIDIYFTRFIVQ